jgi:hypothetical protein
MAKSPIVRFAASTFLLVALNWSRRALLDLSWEAWAVGVLTGYKQQKKEWNVLYDGWKKYILNQAIQGVYIGFWETSIKNKSIYWYKASGGRHHTVITW